MEVSEALGEYIVHADVRWLLDALRERLLVLHAELVPIIGPFALAEPTDEELAAAREDVDWNVLTGRPEAPPFRHEEREWMPAEERKALAARERKGQGDNGADASHLARAKGTRATAKGKEERAQP
jgi:hypothetical protein